MTDAPLLVYGALGVTGRAVTEAAFDRGHRPILAARDPQVVETARRRGLEGLVVELDDAPRLAELAARAVVINAAGPFACTAMPWVRASIAAGGTYVDLNGEVGALRDALDCDAEARETGAVIVSGAGFGVTLGDCLAAHLSRRVPDAFALRVGVAAANAHRSPAVWESTLRVLASGGMRVIEGQLHPEPCAAEVFRGEHEGSPLVFASMPLAEALAAARTTRVADVIAGARVPPLAAPWLRLAGPAIPWLARRRVARGMAPTRAATTAAARELRSVVWAEARSATTIARATLEAGEGYAFAAMAAVVAAEWTRRARTPGAFTPASAFGADFVLSIPGVTRFDQVSEKA